MSYQGDSRDEKAEKKEEAEEVAPLANWFAEVLELRRRANEYKKRAQVCKTCKTDN